MTASATERLEYARAAREIKVRGLVNALSAYQAATGETVTSTDLLSWGSKQWEKLAALAGVNPPGSQTTIDAVVQAIRERETAWDRPLTTFCDRHPAMVTGFRASGKWHVTINGVTGVAVDFAEAVANVMNALFVAEQDGPVSETRSA